MAACRKRRMAADIEGKSGRTWILLLLPSLLKMLWILEASSNTMDGLARKGWIEMVNGASCRG
jgi:hypothetical protein